MAANLILSSSIVIQSFPTGGHFTININLFWYKGIIFSTVQSNPLVNLDLSAPGAWTPVYRVAVNVSSKSTWKMRVVMYKNSFAWGPPEKSRLHLELENRIKRNRGTNDWNFQPARSSLVGPRSGIRFYWTSFRSVPHDSRVRDCPCQFERILNDFLNRPFCF